MQGRVDPAIREQVNRMADACSASSSLILELMVTQQALDNDGRPVWWEAALAAMNPTAEDEGQLPMSA